MKQILGYVALLFVCGSSGLALSEDAPAPAPEDIIRKAIDARGGKEALAKYLSYRVRFKGLMFNGDEKIASTTAVYLYQHPNHTKAIVELKVPDDGLITETAVFNGKKCWYKRNGITTEASDAQFRVARVASYEVYIGFLFPLLNKDQFTLAALPTAKVKGKDTIGVRVSSKGYPDIRLYFDKKTWLLSCLKEYRIKEKPQNDESYEEYYEEYERQKGGIMFFTRKTVVENGKKRFEFELVDIEPLTEVKVSEFSKP